MKSSSYIADSSSAATISVRECSAFIRAVFRMVHSHDHLRLALSGFARKRMKSRCILILGTQLKLRSCRRESKTSTTSMPGRRRAVIDDVGKRVESEGATPEQLYGEG